MSAAILSLVLWATGRGENAALPVANTISIVTSDGSGPFCLKTEFLPYSDEQGGLCCPLVRELGRQALLIAARDGLGLTTRDETLSESFPEKVTSRIGPVEIQVRTSNAGDGRLVLLTPPDASESSASTEIGQFEFDFKSDTYNMYTSLTTVLDGPSRNELVELLRQAGLSGTAAKPDPDGPLPDGVEPLLADMSFVSQYAALRRIHEAIAEDGESTARLGGLVRGYANLAVLTRHHWGSSTHAFSARALLYAERMIHLSGGARDAFEHRAYARALVGLHGAALEDLERLPAKGSLESREKADDEVAQSKWIDVVQPYCQFDQEALLKLADKPGARQLINLLAFDMRASYYCERWNIDAGRAALLECPDAYGIYSSMARWTPMQIQRWAVQASAEALGRRVPLGLAMIDGLPQPAVELLRSERRPSNSWVVQLLNGGVESKAWSPLPMQVAEELRAHVAERGDGSEPSWLVLANLIAEEEFVAVVNCLDVSMNAVEYSKADMVEALMPLVKGHPYAPYVESYAVDRNRDPAKFAEFPPKITVRDPRPIMNAMLNAYWTFTDASGKKYFDLRTEALWRHDYHMPGLMSALQQVDDSWWRMPNLLPAYQRYIEDFQAITPHAPQILCLEINTTENPSMELLADWERRGADDPFAQSKIAKMYKGNSKAAIRCYKKSYQLCPASDTAIALATAYRDAGQEDQWLPSLEAYLKEDDYALGHAAIHHHIAKDYMSRGQWKEAEPHALEAAQTWSGWGLLTASHVYEGLGQWDESERWVREASENYPSYSGLQWYLWCRRTGRGDVANATKHAREFLALDWVANHESGIEYLFVDDMLNERHEGALARLKNGPAKFRNGVYWQTHAALLTKRLGQEDRYQAEMKQLMQIADDKYRESDPTFHALIALLFHHRDDSKFPDDVLGEADRLLEESEAAVRCNYQYFLGELLALNGDLERAKRYWQAAVEQGPFDKYNATFAGCRLIENGGTSRPDISNEPSEESL